MIARIWHGVTDAGRADEYFNYLRETGLSDYQNTPGNQGILVLRRIENDAAHFHLLTLWQSIEAIKPFAGERIEKARYYEKDTEYLIELEPEVQHFEVLAQFNRRSSPGGVQKQERKEISRIIDELKNIHNGDAWHGASLAEALDGLTAESAASRPLKDAHSIWEITEHVRAWEDVFRRRLEGQGTLEPADGDFPVNADRSEKAWAETLEKLEQTYRELLRTVEQLSDSILETKIPGNDYSYRFLLRETIDHKIYHMSQVALLKKSVLGFSH